jgi:hypothetical protein
MSDLTSTEKRKLERLFGMSGGYVTDNVRSTDHSFFLFTQSVVLTDLARLIVPI